MSPYAKAGIGGLIGGAVGAAVWAGITYATHREIGWIGWGVGVLAGFGVRFGARESDGPKFGLLAVGLAAVALLAGKFLVVSLVVSDLQASIDKLDLKIDEETMIADKADEVAAEWRAQKRQVYASTNLKDITDKNYTPAVMAEARRRWLALPPADRQKRIADANAQFQAVKKNFGGTARREGFLASFGPWDLLWFALAGLSAFKIGSGLSND